MTTPSRQLLVYRFPPGSSFQGQLVGALERIESGGSMRILDAMFVGREDPSGDVFAVTMSSDSSAGMISKLLSFRLDSKARVDATTRAIDGPTGPLVQSLASSLEPGAAVTAVLVEHAWEQFLGDAIERLGGAEVDNRRVDDDRIGEAHLSAPSTD
jgi:hypothetical protein